MGTKFNIIQTIFLLTISFYGYCIERDSLYVHPNWNTLSIKSLTPNGKWSIITKSYQNNQDSIYIVNSKTKEKIIKTKVHSLNFLDSDYLASIKLDTLEILNLNTYQATKIQNVSKYTILQKSYILITKNDSSSQIIDTFGKVHWSFSINSYFFFNESKTKVFYAKKEKSSNLSLLSLNTFETIVIAKITDSILSFNLNEKEEVALITYTSDTGVMLQSINISDKQTTNIPISTKKGKVSGIQTAFLNKNNIYIQCYIKKLLPSQTEEIVDVWDASDKNIESKMEPNQEFSKAYVYNLVTKEMDSLLEKNFNESIYINHSNRFLLFNRFENVDYTTFIPSINLYLYDNIKQKRVLIQDSLRTINSNLSYSSNGDYLAIKPNKKWVIVNTKNLKRTSSNQIKSQDKIFWSENSHFVYIIGDGNLWKYNYKTNITENLTNFKNRNIDITILNSQTYPNQLAQGFGVFPRFVKTDTPLLFLVKNPNNNNQTLYKLENGSIKTVIKQMPNHISNITWNQNVDTIIYKTENYNAPSNIVIQAKDEPELLFNNNIPKELYDWRKQIIVDFKDKFGNPLKGILYYPKDFKSNQNYPMITHIYEDQFYLANKFEFPTFFNYKGFSIPLFTELGYFIFLPDTNISDEGPGLSALDCVTSGIEKALEIEPSIDQKRLGLIGQSFGGYKTNFIISQTNLFKAAISGSAVSDLINNYYSYNYNYNKPAYWKFENGQYNIKKSPGSDIELYMNNNPIIFVDRINTPLLTWTGLEDYNVHWEQTRLLFTALKRYNKTHVALFYKMQGHSLSTPKAQKDLTVRTIQWFDQYLQPNTVHNTE
ncbi:MULTISPECIES: alpha/beta hydrolase family protein [unclassified Myroides]|uniref:alpha/beta hydrolase family protein n=1 Tax=unclassified Myroides TaxID=2642485 RepID=UPI003100EE1D